ncbi:hypothetical protein TNCV_3819001 [Trichonephila clavipes]|nr:hypothetical protein TNCV_3819001 [Trichonephila clavipes]
MFGDIIGKKTDLYHITIKPNLSWLGAWDFSFRKRAYGGLFTCNHCEYLIESGIWMQITDQWFVGYGEWIPEKNGDGFALFTMTEGLQRLKSPAATTVENEKVSQLTMQNGLYGSIQPAHESRPCQDDTSSPTALAIASGTSALDLRRLKESCLVRFRVNHMDRRVQILRFPTESLVPGCTVD